MKQNDPSQCPKWWCSFFLYRTGLWILWLPEARLASQFSSNSHVVQFDDKWSLTDTAMPAKFAATTLFSQCNFFLLGLRGRNVWFVLQWGQLPCGSKQVSGFPGDFTSNCVTSGFAAIVGCHISALTLTSLCICQRTWGFLNFCVGTAWFISPFPYYFRVIWSDMARVVVMFNKKSINQKRKTYKAITIFWNQTESKVLTSTEDKMLGSTSKYSK